MEHIGSLKGIERVKEGGRGWRSEKTKDGVKRERMYMNGRREGTEGVHRGQNMRGGRRKGLREGT